MRALTQASRLCIKPACNANGEAQPGHRACTQRTRTKASLMQAHSCTYDMFGSKVGPCHCYTASTRSTDRECLTSAAQALPDLCGGGDLPDGRVGVKHIPESLPQFLQHACRGGGLDCRCLGCQMQCRCSAGWPAAGVASQSSLTSSAAQHRLPPLCCAAHSKHSSLSSSMHETPHSPIHGSSTRP